MRSSSLWRRSVSVRAASIWARSESRFFSRRSHFASETNKLQRVPRAAHSEQDSEDADMEQVRFDFSQAEQGFITTRPERRTRPPRTVRRSARVRPLPIAKEEKDQRTDRQAGTRRPFIPCRATRVSATTTHEIGFEDEAGEGEGACYEQPVGLLFTTRQYCRKQNRLGGYEQQGYTKRSEHRGVSRDLQGGRRVHGLDAAQSRKVQRPKDGRSGHRWTHRLGPKASGQSGRQRPPEGRAATLRMSGHMGYIRTAHQHVSSSP